MDRKCKTCTNHFTQILQHKSIGIEHGENITKRLSCKINPEAGEVRPGDYCEQWCI